MADTPFFPDTNCVLYIDSQQRLWLLWPAILANEWHTALMKYRLSTNYQQAEGPPKWDWSDMHACQWNLSGRYEIQVFL
jgi:hypothetical protein